jgi:hypothetical protein
MWRRAGKPRGCPDDAAATDMMSGALARIAQSTPERLRPAKAVEAVATTVSAAIVRISSRRRRRVPVLDRTGLVADHPGAHDRRGDSPAGRPARLAFRRRAAGFRGSRESAIRCVCAASATAAGDPGLGGASTSGPPPNVGIGIGWFGRSRGGAACRTRRAPSAPTGPASAPRACRRPAPRPGSDPGRGACGSCRSARGRGRSAGSFCDSA